MSTRQKILFAVHPTAGHTNALKAIGSYLIKQGHQAGMAIAKVNFPGPAERLPAPMQVMQTLPDNLSKVGLEIFPLKFPKISFYHGARLPKAQGYKELNLAVRLFTTAIVKQARDIAEYAKQWHADILVGDYLLPAGMLAAKLCQIPYVALYHSALPFPTQDGPLFGSNLENGKTGCQTFEQAEKELNKIQVFMDKRVFKAARKLKVTISKQHYMTSPISDDLNILTTIPELEPGLLHLNGPILMAGPCLPESQLHVDDHPSLQIKRNDKPLLYMTLGTVFNEKPEIFQEVLKGLKPLEAQVIISAGASYPQLKHLTASGIHIFPTVPQVPLLQNVDAVISHGGNNTVQETLGAGKPIVVIPFGGDQLTNAYRVQKLEAGEVILPDDLNAQAVLTAVKKIMTPVIRENAAALGLALKHAPGTKGAADNILKVIR